MLATIATKVVIPLISFFLGQRWNSTITDSVEECERLFKSAKKSIRIVAGELQHDVFGNDQILVALEEACTRKDKPVHVEIIYGPDLDPKSKRILTLPKKAKGKVEIMQASERPKAHFILVDNNQVRIERFHGKNTPERLAYYARNTMFLNRILTEDFDALKASIQKPNP